MLKWAGIYPLCARDYFYTLKILLVSYMDYMAKIGSFTYMVACVEILRSYYGHYICHTIYDKTYNINADMLSNSLEEAYSKNLKPKAIIPVDLFGLPARYRLIEKFAKENDLFIIEDAAQGFGGNIRGKKACSFGDVAGTSFFPAKPLGCYGDGGAIFTNNDELASKLLSIPNVCLTDNFILGTIFNSLFIFSKPFLVAYKLKLLF